jgi:hypothetical protein
MLNVKIGKGLAIDVNTDRLNGVVMDHVVYMGLRNILMDSHASIKKDEDDFKSKSMAVVVKKLDALYNGIIRVAGERASFDAVEGEARRIAMMALRTYFKNKGTKLSSIKSGQWSKMIDERWEKYVLQAEKNLAELASMPEIEEIDLPDDDEC